MAKVELKQPVIDEIAENVKDAESVILVHYSGISVEMDTQLRKELREAGITYKVYKNTMMNFAFKDTECEPLTQYLQGPNAIAISKTDATASARIIAGYEKKIPTLKMLAGIVEGTYYDEKSVEELASIPSREGLLGKLLGSIQSPIADLARVLKQIAEAKPEQDAKAEEAAPAKEAKAEEAAPAEEAKAEEAAPAEEAKAEKAAPAKETEKESE